MNTKQYQQFNDFKYYYRISIPAVIELEIRAIVSESSITPLTMAHITFITVSHSNTNIEFILNSSYHAVRGIEKQVTNAACAQINYNIISIRYLC